MRQYLLASYLVLVVLLMGFAVSAQAASQNYFFGDAGNLTMTGYNNTAVGSGDLSSNTAGLNNTAIGVGALLSNITGHNNVANGLNALLYNTAGAYNVASGVGALTDNTTGLSNVANGKDALSLNTTGSFNIANGEVSLHTNTTGSNNTGIGYRADVLSNNLNNATAIGYNAKVGGSNMMVLGGTGADAVKVGIGTSLPTVALDVVGDVCSTISGKKNCLSAMTSGSGGSSGWTVAGNNLSPTNTVTGQVVIGATAPAYTDGLDRLSIIGTKASGPVRTLLKNNDASGWSALRFEAGSAVGVIALDGSGLTNGYQNMLTLASNNGGLAFFTGGSAAGNERLRIDPAGNVGIGTNAPKTALEVNGAVTIDKGSAYATKAVCYAAGGLLGHCTSALNTTGGCTCAPN